MPPASPNELALPSPPPSTPHTPGMAPEGAAGIAPPASIEPRPPPSPPPAWPKPAPKPAPRAPAATPARLAKSHVCTRSCVRPASLLDGRMSASSILSVLASTSISNLRLSLRSGTW